MITWARARWAGASWPRRIGVLVVVAVVLYAGVSYAVGVTWAHRQAAAALRGIADVLHKADVVDQHAAEHQQAIDALGLAIDNLARERDTALKGMADAEARAKTASGIVATRSQELTQARAARRTITPVRTLEEARDIFAAALR